MVFPGISGYHPVFKKCYLCLKTSHQCLNIGTTTPLNFCDAISDCGQNKAGPARVTVEVWFELFDLVEECGAAVVSDDLCVGSRYFWQTVDTRLEPMESLARYLLEKGLRLKGGVGRLNSFLKEPFTLPLGKYAGFYYPYHGTACLSEGYLGWVAWGK